MDTSYSANSLFLVLSFNPQTHALSPTHSLYLSPTNSLSTKTHTENPHARAQGYVPTDFDEYG